MNVSNLLQDEKNKIYVTLTDILMENVKKFAKKEEIQGIPCKKVYEIFCIWCNENNLIIPTSKHFGRALNLTYGITSKAKYYKGEVIKVYI